MIKSEEKCFMVPKEKFKGSHCCDYCYSSSQDVALLCPIRDNYDERGEDLLEMLVTLGGGKQPAWKGCVEHLLLMMTTYQPAQISVAKTYLSLQIFGKGLIMVITNDIQLSIKVS